MHEKTVTTWAHMFCCYGLQDAPHPKPPNRPLKLTPTQKAALVMVVSDRGVRLRMGASSAEVLVNGLGDAQSIRSDREARVHAATGGKKGRVHDIQVVDIVSSVVYVEDALGRVDSEAAGPADMRVVEELHGAQRDDRVSAS